MRIVRTLAIATALGSFGLMACATDEIGMAREDIPNAARAWFRLLVIAA